MVIICYLCPNYADHEDRQHRIHTNYTSKHLEQFGSVLFLICLIGKVCTQQSYS